MLPLGMVELFPHFSPGPSGLSSLTGRKRKKVWTVQKLTAKKQQLAHSGEGCDILCINSEGSLSLSLQHLKAHQNEKLEFISFVSPDCIDSRHSWLDCAEIYNAGHKQSGYYKMKPLESPSGFSAYCDMSEGGGWTVFQRRSDGSQNFDRDWAEYEQGFGDFASPDGEYWLGNKNLHYLTSQGNYTLKIDLSDFMDEQRFAQYENFKVGDEQSSYKMNCGQYSGTAGDSLTGGFHPEVKWWANHQGMKFSTKDRDNDNYEENCAEEDKAGWWFNRCHSANLNGLYYDGPYSAATDNGIVWYTWHGWWYSLKSVVMKVRPSDFSPNEV
ncbi:fibrinogen-like protein 1 isoform X3 [Podarcis raffonei]|uniref:fibrinogen-like protein 1 isoform X3 n=1 Tax=Podarcis raffonei TaxID=65483 RepID=UPI002329199C|nr:fibrinogen-like protein 1 isoform X3 [Podarcis raffonei]